MKEKAENGMNDVINCVSHFPLSTTIHTFPLLQRETTPLTALFVFHWKERLQFLTLDKSSRWLVSWQSFLHTYLGCSTERRKKKSLIWTRIWMTWIPVSVYRRGIISAGVCALKWFFSSFLFLLYIMCPMCVCFIIVMSNGIGRNVSKWWFVHAHTSCTYTLWWMDG